MLHGELASIRSNQHDALLLKGKVSDLTIDRLIEHLFLKAIVAFETFLEQYFLELVCTRYAPKGITVTRLVTFQSEHAAKDFLCEGRDFATWLPYGDTEARAKRFFAEGRPFTLVDASLKVFITRAYTVRNHAVHSSASARERFLKTVYPNSTITANRTPAKHLREVVRHKSGRNPTQLNIDIYIETMFALAGTIDPQ